MSTKPSKKDPVKVVAASKAFAVVKPLKKRPEPRHIGGGIFCEQTVAPRKRFHPDSFQWRPKGKPRKSGGEQTWLYMGCSPPRAWHPVKRTCKVALETQKVLTPKRPHRRCPIGTRKIDKG